MKYFRKMICYFFGCRSIVTYQKVHHQQYDSYYDVEMTYTCERCGNER